MRHQKDGKKLGRLSAHRRAMWSNMVASLIEHERIETTDVKAKQVRRHADRVIAWSTSLGELLTKDEAKFDAEDRARRVHAIRMAARVVKSRAALTKLFDDVGPRFLGRQGGYTRVIKVRNRRGDAAPMSLVELVVRPESEAKKPSDKAEAKKTTPKSSKPETPAAGG